MTRYPKWFILIAILFWAASGHGANYLGDFETGDVVRVWLTTNDGSGGRVEPNSAFEAADFRIYKDSSDTQRSSQAGWTISSPTDAMVGVQRLVIDLSDNTDAGFYAASSDYAVVLYPDETIDSQNVSRVVATFSIQNRYTNVVAIEGADPTDTIRDSVVDDATRFSGADIASILTDTGSDGVIVNSLNSASITSGAFGAGAIDNQAFASDVGSTAYATNIIALAVRKALDEIKLDHLVAVADADDVVDSSIIAKLASKGVTPDWSTFVNTTDAFEAVRDQGDAAWLTAAGFSTHSAANVWAVATRSLTILDEDSTTIDIDGTTIGTVTTLTGHTAQTGDGYAYLGTNLGLLGANATEAGGTGDQFSGLPNVTLANGAHGGAAASLTLADYSDFTGGTPLDAAGIRTAIGLAAANLDTQLAAIKAETVLIVADTNELQTNQGAWATATGFSTHTAAGVITALKASTGWTAGGAATFADITKIDYAMLRGKFTLVGTTFTLYDDDDATSLGTWTTSATGRTPN